MRFAGRLILAVVFIFLALEAYTDTALAWRKGTGHHRTKKGVGKKHPKSQRHRRSRRHRLSKRYLQMRSAWHSTAPQALSRFFASAPIPAIEIRPIYRDQRYVVQPLSLAGDLDATHQEIVEHAFATEEGLSLPIHPRLTRLIYRAMRHFGAPYVHLISGVRKTRATSRHRQGLAADIVLPGVSDKRLFHYLCDQGFVGVGLYPTSGFVHLDIREASYFWIDRSAPGRKQRTRPTLPKLAAHRDREALDRGETSELISPEPTNMTPVDEPSDIQTE